MQIELCGAWASLQPGGKAPSCKDTCGAGARVAHVLGGVLPAQHAAGLVVGGGHPEPVLAVVGRARLVARPGDREAALARVGDAHVQLLAARARHPEVEPPAHAHASAGSFPQRLCRGAGMAERRVVG